MIVVVVVVAVVLIVIVNQPIIVELTKQGRVLKTIPKLKRLRLPEQDLCPIRHPTNTIKALNGVFTQ